jgi:hypothetical protein
MKKNSLSSLYESALYWITSVYVTWAFGMLSALCGMFYLYLGFVLNNYAKAFALLQNLESKELTRTTPLMTVMHDAFFQNSAVLQEYIIRCARFSEVMKISFWTCLIVFLISIRIEPDIEAHYSESKASIVSLTLLEALSYCFY